MFKKPKEIQPAELVGKTFFSWSYDGHLRSIIYVHGTINEKCLCYSYDPERDYLYTNDVWTTHMLKVVGGSMTEARVDQYNEVFKHIFLAKKIINELD